MEMRNNINKNYTHYYNLFGIAMGKALIKSEGNIQNKLFRILRSVAKMMFKIVSLPAVYN